MKPQSCPTSEDGPVAQPLGLLAHVRAPEVDVAAPIYDVDFGFVLSRKKN